MFGLDIEPGAQSANREVRRLVGVIDRLRALPDDEHLTVQRRAPYTPTALDIAFQPAVPEDDKQLPAPIRWPFATPLTQRTLGVGGYGTVLCATIDGAEAATIIELMAGHDEDTPPHWSTGATPGSGQPTSVLVTANALLRGQSGCGTAGAAPATSHRVAVEPLQDVVLADPAAWNGRYPADRCTTAADLARSHRPRHRDRHRPRPALTVPHSARRDHATSGQFDRSAELTSHRAEPAEMVAAALGVESGAQLVPAQPGVPMVHIVQVETEGETLETARQTQIHCRPG